MTVTPKHNLPPESQPWARDIENRLTLLTQGMGSLEQKVDNAFKGLNSSVALLSQQVTSLPMILTAGSNNNGFGLGSGWNPITQITISRPETHSIARIFAIGGAAVVDTLTGGVTSCSARILINGVASTTFEPSKDAGASAVNNILTPMYTRHIDPISDPVVVRLELNPLNSSAFPASPVNYGVLNIMVAYYRA